MKYVDEYRDPARMGRLMAALHREATGGRYRLMEFCGGHTHALYRFGIAQALPASVEMAHGPGCPVCVLPAGRIDMAVALAKRDGVIFCSYGDMMRVPGSRGASLLAAQAAGADVRLVYSPLDAVAIAAANPGREVVFFGIGFETTMPATALAVKEAAARRLANFSVFCNHVLTPPAIRAIFDTDAPAGIDGIVGPGHVSAVIGSDAYAFVTRDYRLPLVISGFEPADLLESLLMLVRQCNDGRRQVENQYGRAVAPAGNPKALALLDEVFTLRGAFEWRGFGRLPESACTLSDAYKAYDAERRFALAPVTGREHPGCKCPDVLRGLLQPEGCPIFGRACTPESPAGACMVSSEGACAAAYRFGTAQAA